MNTPHKNNQVSLYPYKPEEYTIIKKFWKYNHNSIVLCIILFMIVTLIVIFCYASVTGHVHMFSTEANNYEHLETIVTGGL